MFDVSLFKVGSGTALASADWVEQKARWKCSVQMKSSIQDIKDGIIYGC